MSENVFIAAKIMGQGMAGVFVATLLIVGLFSALSRILSHLIGYHNWQGKGIPKEFYQK